MPSHSWLFPMREKSSLRGTSREACSLSGSNYRRAFTQGGRMIVENHCLILHILQMGEGETREEVPMDVINQKPPERAAQRVQAHREELVERIARAVRPAAPRAAPVPILLASTAGSQRARAIRVRDCSGEQGSLAGREPLLLRPLTLSADHRRVAPCESGAFRLEGTPLPQSPPGTCPHPRQFDYSGGRSHLAK